MDNTSTMLTNSTIGEYENCVVKIHFGITFCYAIMTLCFFVATPAHLWCLWFCFCSKGKIKDTQVFFLNYIVMEILYCMECGLEVLNSYAFYENNTLWYVVYFLFGLSWSGRPLLQVCICIEQYLAVIHPVTFLSYKGIKYRIAASAVAGLIAIAYAFYEAQTMIFPDFIYISVFIVALAMICFCCVSVLCALKHSGPGDTHATKPSGKDGGNQQKKQAFDTIFSALLLVVFTYLPQTLLIVFTIIQVDHTLYTCNIVPFMISLNVLGVIITPWMKLYKEYQKVSKGNSSSTMNSSSTLK